jgi:hypothetical protein
VKSTGGNNQSRNEVKPIGSVVIPYVKGNSEKFKRIGNRYIRTIFKTKHTLRDILMRTTPMSDPQLTAHCIYSIPCECGRSYVGKTSRPLSVRIQGHKHNLKNGLLEKLKLAQHAFEEDHQVSWNEAKILHPEGNGRYRKYNESAHMACMDNPISQPSLKTSSIWIPLIKKEINTLQGRSYLYPIPPFLISSIAPFPHISCFGCLPSL